MKNITKTILSLAVSVFMLSVLFVHGASAFNEAQLAELKAGNSCPRCDLSGANLSRINLSGANLSEAVLVTAIWTNGDMCHRPSVGSCDQ